MGSCASKRTSPPSTYRTSVQPSCMISPRILESEEGESTHDPSRRSSSSSFVSSSSSLSAGACSPEVQKRKAVGSLMPKGIRGKKLASKRSPRISDVKMQVLRAKMRAFTRKKETSDWEKYNIDDFLALCETNKNRQKKWYDIVDALVSAQEPVIYPDTKRKGWRTIRLYISNTFKDMHSEREHLVKMIIPPLRQWCEKRRLHLMECDLRWGMPKTADTRETMLTCLSEIDRCRQENGYTYFLSVMSERYGHVMDPDDVPSDIKARYNWVPGMSVTALEIMTGAYWDKNPNALFMIRNPSFLQHVDDDIKDAYIESDAEAIESLRTLKEKIKSSFPDRVVEYDCTVEGREGDTMVLGNLDDFGKVILKHFKARIAEQYPNTSTQKEMSEMDIKKLEQTDFMHQRSEVLLGRKHEVKKIDDYINSTSTAAGLLTLVGYPGNGKSSLMAYSVKRQMKNPAFKVFFHFVGVTPDSSTAISILSRLYRECLPADQQASMPLSESDMLRFVPTMLREAGAHARAEGFSKLVIFVDALNQIEETGNARNLTWLPRLLPEGVRVVVSTLDGECLDSVRNHTNPPQEVLVLPLSVPIRKCIVEELLLPFNKRLDSEQVQMDILVKKPDSGRPLYLSVACEELRVFRDFKRLTEKVRSLPPDLLGTTETVLKRVVEEFGGELVQATLCLIETSQFGLEERELLQLLAATPVLPKSPNDCSDFFPKLPMATWGFLYVGLRSFLQPTCSSRGGRVNFYHHTVGKVVRRLYLSDKQTAAKWHGRLIQFFNQRPYSRRKAEELPYQYLAMGDLDGLRQFLTTRDVFEVFYTEYKPALLLHWQAAGGYQLAAECYEKVLQDILSRQKLDGTKDGEQLSMKVGWFMVDMGEYDKADDMLTALLTQLSDKYGEEALELCDPLHAMMTLVMRKALHYRNSASPGFIEGHTRGRQLVPLTEKVHRKKFAPTSNELGEVLLLCGYFQSSLLEECKLIFETNINKVGLAEVLYTLGENNQYHENMDVPIKMFEDSLALCKIYFGHYHLSTARCVQLYGQMYWNNYMQNKSRQDWLEKSLPYYSMELGILQEVLGPEHPTTVRSQKVIISVLQSLEHTNEADKLIAEQPEISKCADATSSCLNAGAPREFCV